MPALPRVFTIAPTRPFVDVLAAGLLARHADDPLTLADVIVLLPTRRACRTLREAFLRRSEGRALLLPRMMPLGDVDEDDLALAGAPLKGETPADLPPAVPDLRRRLLLARLIQARPLGPDGRPPTPEMAAHLARDLAALLDRVQTNRLSFDRLVALVPERYAAHWGITVEFLRVLFEVWPAVLEEEGALDPAARRDRLMTARAERWRGAPPDGPVIAAGSTGSIPATADLLAVVADLPQGEVVLPGLDRDLDDDSWAALDPTHPQYGLRELLGKLGVARRDVPDWPSPLSHVLNNSNAPPQTGLLPPEGGGWEGAEADNSRLASSASPPPQPSPVQERESRLRLVSEALRPAETTDAWRAAPALPPSALAGVERVTAPGPREEAEAIALMMREALETPGRTAALVTPDRDLARRVAALLERWGLTVDDSAGRPLAVTPPGAFLRLLAVAAAEGLAPGPLLDLLRHPLAGGGLDVGRFRADVRALERRVLRGPRPPAGFDGLRRVARARGVPVDGGLMRLLDRLERQVGAFLAMMEGPALPLRALVETHMEAAEALAATRTTAGPLRLWAETAGEAAAAFAAELAEAADGLPDLEPRHYPGLFDALMTGRAVRPPQGGHPRLSILGPLEARAWHADLMILGGLNEGTWPPAVEADPWMSRPMQADFGLPPPEQRVGLSAHDFAQAMGAPRVALTRAERVEGTPTVPSRWLLRLDAATTATGLAEAWTDATRAPWLDWAARLRAVEAVEPAPPPAPAPPVDARPDRLSVTRIETWRRDPYGIYAQYVLGLEALEALDRPLGASDYGELVHAALERFRLAHPGTLPDDVEGALIEIGRDVFAEGMADAAVAAFWWPRFDRTVTWVAAQERARAAALRRVHVEVKGEMALEGVTRPFTLTGRADRVEAYRDGSLVVVDHKTGQPPRKTEVAAGYAPQLPLEAAMLAAGAFPDVPAGPVTGLEYWRLRGARDQGGEVRAVADDPPALAAEALAGLVALVNLYARPETPYPARPVPDKAPRYSDYEHLARVPEWSTAGDEEGEG
ncbi:double-strand break repair protein AddB [Rhodospira trueperi]|uniref:ATP-dependent helicase/nuclease subunit B n=1 Tax=Rhodospira trueperi TaxID=69960 RepID=A0A1G7A317_9PROT|nr:double-strand break repair protein AddB [Rhodospira trueperi]SDE09151.1 ATP-dependent helicase/nuclease subunit B [Rhodospira trueperi]